jgi:hypothetical protein
LAEAELASSAARVTLSTVTVRVMLDSAPTALRTESVAAAGVAPSKTTAFRSPEVRPAARAAATGSGVGGSGALVQAAKEPTTTSTPTARAAAGRKNGTRMADILSRIRGDGRAPLPRTTGVAA